MKSLYHISKKEKNLGSCEVKFETTPPRTKRAFGLNDFFSLIVPA